VLAVAEALARDGRRAGESLELAKTWLRDRLVATRRPDLVVYGDRRDELRRPAREEGEGGQWIRQIQRIQEAQRALDGNAAVRLTLESLFFDLSRGQGPPGGD